MNDPEAEFVKVYIWLREHHICYDSLVWNDQKQTWEPYSDGKLIPISECKEAHEPVQRTA